MTTQPYAIIATAHSRLPPALSQEGVQSEITVQPGYVLNRVMWDGGTKWAPPVGTEARADPQGALAIGSTTTV